MKHSYSKRRTGLSLIDLAITMCVLSIGVAISLPALQQLRECSRKFVCEQNMADLAVDAFVYHDTFQRLPCQLGAPGEVELDDWSSIASPDYWENFQYTSPLALGIRVSGRLEELTGQSDPIDPIFWDYDSTLDGQRFFDLAGWEELAATNAPIFRCPSFQFFNFDPDNDSTFFGPTGHQLVIQPIRTGSIGTLRDTSTNSEYGITNYTGCGGAGPGAANSNDPEFAAFRGMISTREAVTLDQVMNADGLASSIMYGENIGHHRRNVFTDVRFISAYQSWLNSGISMGRGGVDWKADPPLSDDPTKDFPSGFDPRSGILGRTGFSTLWGFGSAHPDGVGFVFGDGHVATVSRDTDWQILYQMFGAFDADFPGL